MKDKKLDEVVTVEEGKKPPMEIIHEGPTQPEERVQYSDALEKAEEDAEDDEIKPENSGFFAPKSRAYMALALKEAKKAAKRGEVPVGCVIVKDGKVLAKAYNRMESDGDPTAHAEILAIREACDELGDWRLDGCSLYVNLEPCMMCTGAILQSKIDRVYYACESDEGALRDRKKDLEVYGGFLEDKSKALLDGFFKSMRN